MKELIVIFFFPLLFINSLIDLKTLPVAFACRQISLHGYVPEVVTSKPGEESRSMFLKQQSSIRCEVALNTTTLISGVFSVVNLKYKPFLHPI